MVLIMKQPHDQFIFLDFKGKEGLEPTHLSRGHCNLLTYFNINVSSLSVFFFWFLFLFFVFSGVVEKVFKTSSPVDIFPDKEINLEFIVKGWPRPRVVWYKPDGKQIINGSEGFQLSEELVGEDTIKSFLRNPKKQENLEGDYKCIGENSIPGWSSKVSGIIELIYKCKRSDYFRLFNTK